MRYDNSKKLAGKHYAHDMKQNDDELSQGLSLTHEQVSDNYMEGTIDGVIEKENGKSVPLKDL
ncbi:YozQ family protein [Caldibacillus lycopersici]|uniref:YozQ family protein n=1 Tax=Perspicuibacillus lycopersici TaxID=1325689 RepID=A0AAE3LN51_9BACI|nr:YozQ family protein [Perspicuibacillus lycopersici]MCU9613586.1 YozQ family protein [Perspicuibacillus lycopersici]